MLIDVEGGVKPASKESRLVMIQLEPRAEKITQREKRNQIHNGKKGQEEFKDEAQRTRTFLTRLMEACCGWGGLHGSSCA